MNFCPGPGTYSPYPHLNPAKLRTSSSSYFPDHMRSGSISTYSKFENNLVEQKILDSRNFLIGFNAFCV